MKTPGLGLSGWLLMVGGGVSVVVAVFVLFRTPTVPPENPVTKAARPAAEVQLAWDGDTLLKEEAELRDPTPLFLPTKWNASEDAVPSNVRREPGSSLQDYPPIMTFKESGLRLEFPTAVAVPAHVADVFANDKTDRPFIGLGQRDQTVASLPPRAAFVEVIAAGSGDLIMTQPLLEAKPPDEAPWQPLEFLVAIDASGIVRPPVLTESSRVPTVDGYFQDYLVKVLHLGERLAPGFYRICIGP